MTRIGLAGAAAALGVALVTPAARAHALESSLEALPGHPNALLLHSQFSSGEPVSGAEVALVAPGHAPIALGHTDGAGQLRFDRPAAALLAAAVAWEVRIAQGPGHRDYLELPEALGAPLPAPSPALSTPPPPRRTAPVPLFGWGGGSAVLLIGALALRQRRLGR